MRILKLIYLLIIIISFTTVSFPQEELSLEEAVKITLSNNYSINLARNDSKIADNNSNIGNAGFLPSLDASGSYIKSSNDTKQEYFDGRTIDRTGAKSNNISAGGELNWTIFDGLQMFASLDMLKELNRIGAASTPDLLMTSCSACQVSPHLNRTWSPGCKFSALTLLMVRKALPTDDPSLLSFPVELET